jgi:hypothetical protein
MATEINTPMNPMSSMASGQTGSMTGAELNNIPGTASLRAINGSAIVTFDSSSSPRIPTEGQLPKSFETSIRKTGM